MLVNTGGTATQPKAPGHDRPLAAPLAARHGRPVAIPRAPNADVPPANSAEAPGQHRLRAVPSAPDHARSAARHTKAPGHDRPRTALPAARHGRPVAIPRAPGADVPSATTAGAPGPHCLCAAKKAPGHDRPHAAPPAAWHGRPVAIPRAPGADVPSASTAGAPGPHRLRAAKKAPGHGRPLAALRAARHDRPVAILKAPGTDVPPASTAGAPGQHRPRAVAIATAPLPAGPHRPRQKGLPHTPANPRTHTHSPTHQDTIHAHARYRRTTRYAQSRASMSRTPIRDGNPRPPVATGGPQGGQVMSPVSSLRRRPQSISFRTTHIRHSRASMSRTPIRGGNPSCSSFHPENPDADKPLHPLSKCWRGGRGVRLTSHQAHPAIQVPPQPRSCSTARTGLPLNYPARAPPQPTRRKPILAWLSPLATWWRGPG